MSDTSEKPDRGDGRTPDGKFAAGNRCSPGRKHAVRESQNLRRFREVIHLDRIGELAIELLAIAIGPKYKAPERLRAIQILLSYSLPQAGQRLDAELKIHVEDGEFRVAGASPSEVDYEMIAYVDKLIEERTKYERDIEAKYSTNGEDTK